jgi:5-methyltetrahydrofolate--homocysteine methyltransferase
VEFISQYGGETPAAPVAAKTDMTLGDAISAGLKSEAAQLTAKLLETTPAMEIVNSHLIPALDKAGAEFEAGKIFLPQLISAASAAQSAFEVIRTKLCESGAESVSSGTVVIATVKGDIHDIGKNIVKVLLENYGYKVIDLGKDVDCETVAQAAAEHGAPLVGLSALMTTTMPRMREMAELLKKENFNVPLFVGGAAVDKEFADSIGAFYSPDAMGTVRMALEMVK